MPREMKDSGIEWIGEIPAEWEIIRFKFLHNVMNTGEAIDKEYWSDDEKDTVFYTAGLLPIYTSYHDFPEWKYTNGNDLLLARNGTPYVYYPVINACYTDHIIRAEMKADINRKFVKYGLQQSISSVIVNQVSIATWSASLWNEQTIPWPPLSEQQKISAHLDSECAKIDDVITKTKATIEEYKKLKQSVITEAVTKGIRPNREMRGSGIEWIGEIPKEWEITRTKYIASSMYKGNGITKEDVVENGDTPCVRYGEIYTKYNYSFDSCKTRTDREKINSPQYFSYGDILFVCTGELVEEIGKNIVYLGNEKCFAGGDIIVMHHNQEPRYLNYALGCSAAQTQKSCGKSKLKVVHISASEIGSIITFLPDFEEQQEIADYLDKKCYEIDNLIAKKEQIVTELENYKKSLIYEYVTGKKEVIQWTAI